MSKNQKTYLLLVAVIVIWGAIGFQIYGYLNPEEAQTVIQSNDTFVPNKQVQAVTYTITPDYRDPFFGKLYRKPKPKTKKVVPKKTIVFPPISYDGVVSSGKNSSFLITINGVQEIYKVGQTMKGVELVKGDTSEVTLKYKGKTKKYSLGQ